MKYNYWPLSLLQFMIGITAVVGGFGLITSPDGSLMGLSIGWLDDSPFDSYLVLGLILFIVIGLGNILSGYIAYKKHPFSGEMAITLGAFLMTWILVQMVMIPFLWLQPLYFFFGLIQFGLGVSAYHTSGNQ